MYSVVFTDSPMWRIDLCRKYHRSFGACSNTYTIGIEPNRELEEKHEKNWDKHQLRRIQTNNKTKAVEKEEEEKNGDNDDENAHAHTVQTIREFRNYLLRLFELDTRTKHNDLLIFFSFLSLAQLFEKLFRWMQRTNWRICRNKR